MGSGIDLDLSNGYYIYIMAALYFSVPMVTGQLVLGAKAGVASSVGGMFNSVTGEAGRASMTGKQHADVNAITSNANALGQAAYAKAMRAKDDQGKSLALNQLETANAPLHAELAQHKLDGMQAARRTGAGMFGLDSKAFNSAQLIPRDAANSAGELFPGGSKKGKGGGAAGGGGSAGLNTLAGLKSAFPVLGAVVAGSFTLGKNNFEQRAHAAEGFANAKELDTKWDSMGQQMVRSGA
jgi:hypothetical protein